MSTCQGCGAPMKLVPAGFSQKTQKSYQAFEACSAKCGFKKPRTQGYGQPAPQPQIGVANDMLHELQEIKSILLLINSKMPSKAQAAAPAVEVDGPANPQDELAPDEEIPF